jgi:hypothetical protein
MSAPGPFDPWSRRLAVYGYLAPLVSGKRVLEIGCGEGVGAARLAELGAESVVGADTDQAALARARSELSASNLGFAGLDRRSLGPAAPFDLIVVPEAAALLRPGSALNPTAARGLLGAQGRLVVMVSNADRPGSAADGARGYYEVVEALEALFPKVRMFGVTPFAAYGLAEFAEHVAGLRIDGGLVEDASLQPTHYVAVAGPDDEVDLGYALVQVPFGPGDIEAATGVAATTAAGAGIDDQDVFDLRRQLAEAQGQNEGVLRVSRAQAEEIEELRGRLRRGAEARTELDQEVVRLRRALAEADESVLDLTRRTREEMAALAQRITSGLRPDAGPRGEDQLTIAARESSLSERDERIAALEADKQDLMWTLDALSAQVADSSGRAAAPRAPAPTAGATSAPAERSLALEQYRQAAAVHLGEVNRLREALAEQSTQVSELEDALALSEERLSAALAETAGLRRHLTEVEEADRGRRSRLAEVEGKMLRLERQAAVAAAQENQGVSQGGNGDPGAFAALEDRLRQSESSRLETERRWQDAVQRMSSLERAVNEQVASAAASSASAAIGAEAETALRELGRLRDALERSEEQLWETKGQLLLDRERMAVLEHQVATVAAAPESDQARPAEPTVTEAAHQAIMGSVLKELVEIEASVRQEVSRLDSVERMIEGWRADLAVTDADGDVSFTRVD